MKGQQFTQANSRYSEYSRKYSKRDPAIRNRTLNAQMLIEVFLWWGFLCLIVCSAFISHVYTSQLWLQFSAALYLYSGLYVCHVLLGGRVNVLAVKAAKWPITVLAMALVWLAMQIIWPFQINASSQLLFGLSLSVDIMQARPQAPAWFSPEIAWTLVPAQTQALLMSGFMCLVFFCLTLSLCDSRARVKQILVVILLVGLVHATSGIVAKYTHLILVEPKQIDGHFSAARGWFINRNHFAAFISLTMVTPIAFILKKMMRSRSDSFFELLKNIIFARQALFILSLLLGVFAMIVSQSRAGFLALPIAAALIALLNRSQLKKVVGVNRTMFVLGIIVIVIMLTFGQEIVSRLSNSLLSVGERSTQWAITWQVITEQWLVGYGGGSYATVFQIVREHAPLRNVIYDQSHSYYLHLWLEQGLVGLLLWLSFVGLVFLTAYKSFKNSSSATIRSLQIACSIVVLAALLQSFVDFNLQILNMRLYFFVIIALMFCAPSLHKHRSRRPSNTKSR